jgi:hypothetical protein
VKVDRSWEYRYQQVLVLRPELHDGRADPGPDFVPLQEEGNAGWEAVAFVPSPPGWPVAGPRKTFLLLGWWLLKRERAVSSPI